MNKRNT